MALLTGVVQFQDAAGKRIDLPREDGTYQPIAVRLGANITATCEIPEDGQLTVVTLVATNDTSSSRWVVNTLAELDALPSATRGDTAFVINTLQFFDAVPPNSYPPSNTVRTGIGVQWTLNAATEVVVLNGLTQLKTRAGLSVGMLVLETSIGDFWGVHSEGTSSSADDITVVNGVGVQLIRIVGSGPKADYVKRSDWYVDANAGSDWSAGTDVAPLKSPDEIQRRWGSDCPLLQQSVTVHLNAIAGDVILNARALNSTIQLTVVATATAQVTTTISSITGWTHGVQGVSDPVPALLKATGVLSWSLHARRRLRSINLCTWIDTPCPDGYAPLASDTASTAPWGDGDAVALPSVTDPLVIEELQSVDNVSVTLSGGKVTLDSLSIATSLRVVDPENTWLRGCLLQQSCAYESQSRTLPQLRYVRIEAPVSDHVITSMRACYCYNRAINVNGELRATPYLSNTLCRVTSTAPAATSCFIQARCGNGQLIDVQGFQHRSDASVLRFSDNQGATNHARTLQLQGFSGIAYLAACIALASGTKLVINRASVFNVVTKAAGVAEFVISQLDPTLGVGGFNYSAIRALHAAPFGFVPGVWRGEATLSAGVKAVDLVPPLAALFPATVTPHFGLKNSNGTAAGPIELTSQNGSSFTINSMAGSSDGQTFWWDVASDFVSDILIVLRDS